MIDITKTYRTRDGREVTNLRVREASDFGSDVLVYPFRAEIGSDRNSLTFAGDGRFLRGGTDGSDLIPVEDQPAPTVPPIDSEANRQARSEALCQAMRLPGARTAAWIVREAETFYGFLTGSRAA